MTQPYFLCQCDRDWCWCSNRAATQGAVCLMCQEGAHAEASGERLQDPRFSMKPGCVQSYGALMGIGIMIVASWAAVIGAIWLVVRALR